MEPSRAMWRLLEPVHAVLYYAPAAFDEAGRLGFDVSGRWASYFAWRAAPLGAAGPVLVGAAFYSFAPATVREHVGGAWDVARPDEVRHARLAAARAALGTVLDERTLTGAAMVEAAGIAEHAVGRIVERGDVGARPLAAANLDLPRPEDPALRLWQAATVLREHRGDGHLHALVEADLDPVECLVQLASDSDVDEETFAGRGWTDDEWRAALDRLRSRGLVEGRTATAAGHALRDRVERRTDELAAGPWRGTGGTRGTDGAGGPDVERLAGLVAPWTTAIGRSGLLPAHGTLAFSRPVAAA